jgi:hypothetical protein
LVATVFTRADLGLGPIVPPTPAKKNKKLKWSRSAEALIRKRKKDHASQKIRMQAKKREEIGSPAVYRPHLQMQAKKELRRAGQVVYNPSLPSGPPGSSGI